MIECPNCENKENFGWVELQEGDSMGWGQLFARICKKCGIVFIEQSNLDRVN